MKRENEKLKHEREELLTKINDNASLANSKLGLRRYWDDFDVLSDISDDILSLHNAPAFRRVNPNLNSMLNSPLEKQFDMGSGT